MQVLRCSLKNETMRNFEELIDEQVLSIKYGNRQDFNSYNPYDIQEIELNN